MEQGLSCNSEWFNVTGSTLRSFYHLCEGPKHASEKSLSPLDNIVITYHLKKKKEKKKKASPQTDRIVFTIIFCKTHIYIHSSSL